jgi:adenine-specific DNA-methyltransferase
MTLNYIGSKKSLLPFLNEIFSLHIDLFNQPITMGDGFSGTGSVGEYFFSNYKWNVTSIDIEKYSFLINYSKLCVPYSERLNQLINQLNGPSENTSNQTPGLITEHYSGDRKFFTVENTLKIDAIRIEIERLHEQSEITLDEYRFLLASLVYSADKVANVACIYGAFLKQFKKSSCKKMVLFPIHERVFKNNGNKVERKDIVDVDWSGTSFVYFDPPYNSRQYGSNYFVLNFIIDYDSSLKPKGKTGIIPYFKSAFCQKTNVEQAFISLLSNKTLPSFIFISYNNEGLLKFEDMKNLLMRFGAVILYKKNYKKFKAQTKVVGDFVYEYLWFVDRTKQSSFQMVEIFK